MSARSPSNQALGIALVLAVLGCAVLWGQWTEQRLLNEAMAAHVQALLRACQGIHQ